MRLNVSIDIPLFFKPLTIQPVFSLLYCGNILSFFAGIRIECLRRILSRAVFISFPFAVSSKETFAKDRDGIQRNFQMVLQYTNNVYFVSKSDNEKRFEESSQCIL